jgi:signal transduction histidine kinase
MTVAMKVLRRQETLRGLAPPVRRVEFWIVQALVIGIAGAHTLLEAAPIADLHGLEVVPVSLNLLPVAYAALVFGLRGAVPTALWTTALTLPNVFLWHDGAHQAAEVWQLGLVVVVGLLVGHRVDREQRVRAEIAAHELDQRLMTEEYARLTLAAREEERRHVARELHDGPLQSVMVAWRRLELLGEEADSEPEAALERTCELMELVAADLRRFSRELRPSTLDDLGLYAALRGEVTDFERRTDTPAVFRSMGSEPEALNGESATMLLRVCQEALRNVERHAHASRVTVTAEADESQFALTVKDDGRGMPALPSPRELVAEGRLGMVGMQERARLAGGVCEIRSDARAGTTIAVAVPLRSHV